MLYDPKWEQKTETKADPFKLDTLIAWLEKQPASQAYCYSDVGGCLLHSYFTDHGFPGVIMGGETFAARMPAGGFTNYKFDASFDKIAQAHPRTMGAALNLARNIAKSQ